MDTYERNPLLSVIVPVCNTAAYLRKCLDSIVHQTYLNMEIILVADGASTDGSTEICEEYAASDSRIRVLHRPHEMLPAGRKAGVQAASGEYVAYVDSDDWIDLDAYEQVFMAMGDQAPDVLIHGFIREYEEKGVLCHQGLPLGYYDVRGIENEILPHLMETRCAYQWELRPGYQEAKGGKRSRHGPVRRSREMKIYSGLWNKVAKRSLLLQSQMQVPDELTEGEDLACSVRTLLLAGSVMVTDLAPYHYLMRPTSLARSNLPYSQSQRLFRSLYAALKDCPLRDLYMSRISGVLFERILLNRYERFLSGPFSDVLFGSLDGLRVALYGAGKLGREIYHKTAAVYPDQITLWVDRNCDAARKEGLPVEPVEALFQREYDVVLIALLDETICEEIKRDLAKRGIAPEKLRYATATEEALAAAGQILREDSGIGQRKAEGGAVRASREDR